MAIAQAIIHPIFFVIILIIITFPVIHSMSETEALLSLKNSLSNTQALDSWVADSVPCTEDDQWEGVFCYNGIVSGLRLGGMGLLGDIDVNALLELKGLRTISLVNNSFSGSIPQFNRIGFLKAIYLSGNKFSGDIPQEYFKGMRSLKKLLLSDNQFTGHIPSSLAEIPQLMVLHLENNQFSGSIPDLNNPSLVQLNLSNNNLEGKVPASLLKFNESSFGGNPGLCGNMFGRTCELVDERSNAGLSNVAGNVSEPNRSRSSMLEIVVFVVASVVIVSLIVFLIVRSRRKKNEDVDMISAVEVQVAAAPVKRDVDTSVKKASSSRRGGSSHGKGVGEVVMVNSEKGVFGLPDLMRAAAEVLGNGGLGSSYKAVMANGVAVVVKRIRDMNILEKDGFDAEMRKLGKLKHWNILTPLAYHYRKEEKLVISEYVPGGSLMYLLHGDKGPSHAELDWPARLNIVQGIAEGMRYLLTNFASSDLPHGNLKSSNILLGPDYDPLLVDYGFSHMANPSSVAQTLFAYKAPEAAQGQISPSCDVYCLGVVILEILTGKYPSQYLSNGKGGTDVVQWVATAISEGREAELLDPEIASSRNSLGEMVQLLHIGAACTQSNPQERLDMVEGIRRIEEIKTNGGLESRTIEVLPSLRDGYADSHVCESQENGDQSRTRSRHGTNSFGSQGNFEFGIS
ncbi:pollen receptor-like kinase 3 [Abrus precatorius]|uniref:Pollen receptor-like kinase 3 n=1 Tax=Abrus precatorius TaxID=3816 RepID=A0A8B8K117_ABRPR|nr:pollen receptor-like kinase 3 [Abrus precatorius]